MSPSFFKVFFPDSSSERLQLPNAFVALTGLREMVAKEFVLRNVRGRDWKVKTSLRGDKVYFEDGWRKFVEENDLKNVVFIVFQSEIGRGNLFKFKIFEVSSGCLKPEAEQENVILDDMMNMEIEEEEETETEVDDCVMVEGEDNGDDHDDDDEEDEDDDDYEEEQEDEEDEDEDEEEEEEKYIVMDHPRVDKAFDIRKEGIGRGSGSKDDSENLNEYGAIAEKYFFHRGNPYFVAKRIKNRENELHIPYNIIKDFSPNLAETITLSCQKIYISSQEQISTSKNPLTDTKGEIHKWKDGRVCIKGWSVFCRKNRIGATDTCFCEVVLGKDARVEMLQVHLVRKQF